MTTRTSEAREMAETAAAYLGGFRRLSLMVGANNFAYDKGGTLSFRFKGCRKANAVRLVLNGSDLYDVEFHKITKAGAKLVAAHSDLYFDQLRETFERETGLYLTF